jgi:hypothetical protein
MNISLGPPSAAIPNKIELVGLSDAIKRLMVRYSDAIEACGSVPTLSLLPPVKLYFELLLWLLATELCIVVAPIDLIIILCRKVFGRPRLVLGRQLYNYFMRPLLSVWSGEIPSFKIIRQRYLTRLLLFYRAQFIINALHRVYNRRHLDLLAADHPDLLALTEVEAFQKSFDLFQKITADSYQLGAIAVGGPLIALLSIVIQKALLPALTYLWNLLGGPTLTLSTEQIGTLGAFVILFSGVTVWIFVSAWMEMRSILISLDVYRVEHQACLFARIKFKREIPYDLLLYFSATALVGVSMYQDYDRGIEHNRPDLTPLAQHDLLLMDQVLRTEALITFALLLFFGLVAAARRLYLSKR